MTLFLCCRCRNGTSAFSAFLEESYVDREWYDFYTEVASFKSLFSKEELSTMPPLIANEETFKRKPSFMSFVKQKILRKGSNPVVRTVDDDEKVALYISRASVIIRRFVALDSFDTISLDSGVRERIFERFEHSRRVGKVPFALFDEACEEAVAVLRDDLFPDFLRSRHAQPSLDVILIS